VVTCQPGQPASFQPGGGNGRALGDNAFDIAVAVLAGRIKRAEAHYLREFPGPRQRLADLPGDLLAYVADKACRDACCLLASGICSSRRCVSVRVLTGRRTGVRTRAIAGTNQR